MRLRSGKSVENDEHEVISAATASEPRPTGSVAVNEGLHVESEQNGAGVGTEKNNTASTPTLSQAIAAGGAIASTMNNGMSNLAKTATRTTVTSKDFRPHDKNVLFILKLGGSFLVIMYFIIPAIVKLNPWIMSEIAFLHRIRVPFFVDLEKPTSLGLNGTLNFRIKTPDDLSLGAWHILPEDLQDQNAVSSNDFSSLLNNGAPIVIYFHGNAGTRATEHRVALYKVLSKAGFHTIAVDYRGYGDSEGSPSEEGLVNDALASFDWVKARSGNSKVYFWGHSLGTGVATHAASKACKRGTQPTGVILEAAFTSIIDAAVSHPLSTPFRYMPYFTWVFVESLKYNNIYFSNDRHIKQVTVPILILHAKDDNIVPFQLGQKLYEVARSKQTDVPVHFVGFEAEHHYGHDDIYKAADLMQIVKDFMAGRLRS